LNKGRIKRKNFAVKPIMIMVLEGLDDLFTISVPYIDARKAVQRKKESMRTSKSEPPSVFLRITSWRSKIPIAKPLKI
jgi:hypothetical protein